MRNMVKDFKESKVQAGTESSLVWSGRFLMTGYSFLGASHLLNVEGMFGIERSLHLRHFPSLRSLPLLQWEIEL